MNSRPFELRLTKFKTFQGATLRLSDMTVLIGRNSSGKSNALDGLEVLPRLAAGVDIVDALDSRRGDEGPLRGASKAAHRTVWMNSSSAAVWVPSTAWKPTDT
jgi:predicted ATP-dependent endonuclease of OLD family